VHVDGVVAADVLPELADRFEEGQALDVAIQLLLRVAVMLVNRS
jgi:hypothetical protein